MSMLPRVRRSPRIYRGQAGALDQRRLATETQLGEIDTHLNDDRQNRARSLRRQPPEHITNGLGPQPEDRHPASYRHSHKITSRAVVHYRRTLRHDGELAAETPDQRIKL